MVSKALCFRIVMYVVIVWESVKPAFHRALLFSISGKSRKGISNAGDAMNDLGDEADPRTRLVISGGEGYVDFRIGMGHILHSHDLLYIAHFSYIWFPRRISWLLSSLITKKRLEPFFVKGNFMHLQKYQLMLACTM